MTLQPAKTGLTMAALARPVAPDGRLIIRIGFYNPQPEPHPVTCALCGNDVPGFYISDRLDVQICPDCTRPVPAYFPNSREEINSIKTGPADWYTKTPKAQAPTMRNAKIVLWHLEKELGLRTRHPQR